MHARWGPGTLQWSIPAHYTPSHWLELRVLLHLNIFRMSRVKIAQGYKVFCLGLLKVKVHESLCRASSVAVLAGFLHLTPTWSINIPIWLMSQAVIEGIIYLEVRPRVPLWWHISVKPFLRGT